MRLASFLDRSDLSDKAGDLVRSMREILMNFPIACPDLVTALVTLIDSPTQVTIYALYIYILI